VIHFRVNRRALVRVNVHRVRHHLRFALLRRRRLGGGRHALRWHGRTPHRLRVPAGYYRVVVRATRHGHTVVARSTIRVLRR
jgi:hypothetical protein